MVMKNAIKFIVLVVLFLVLILLYFIYDRKGYYQGIGCRFCNKDLPYGLKPEIYSHDLIFVILDDDGFELEYFDMRFKHNKPTTDRYSITSLEYGYNDTSLLLKVKDTLNNTKYLLSYKTDYAGTKHGFPNIRFKNIDNGVYNQIKDNYQWKEISLDAANDTEFVKFISVVGAWLVLCFFVKKLLKLGKLSHDKYLGRK
jgi:hypothetical protein